LTFLKFYIKYKIVAPASGLAAEPDSPFSQLERVGKEDAMKIFAGLIFVALALLSSSSAFANCTNAPIAHADVYNMAKNTTITIFYSNLVANDTDADGDPLTARVTGGPSTGFFCGSVPGTAFCYAPPTNFTGLVSIPYEVSDGCNVDGGDILIFVQ
jgi:hypothetical protein